MNKHVSVAVLSLCAGIVSAGPLTPPAGPVAPTPGPEPRIAINATNTPGDADSIFRISQPGSYYLTGNVTGASGKRGIEIVSADVTIDLMGFRLDGVVGSLQGVQSTAAQPRITVRNGSVTNWGSDGLDLSNGGGTEEGAFIADVVASDNGGNGINATAGSIVRNCIARGNATVGILVSSRGTIESCVSEGNTTHGISVGAVGIVRDCRVNDNTLDGIRLSDGALAEGCVSYSNGRDGFFVSSFQHALIERCMAKSNLNDGFEISENSVIRGCLAVSNTSAGINSAGTGNRIEGNTLRENGDGIRLTSSLNLVINNSAGGNTTNYDIAANNRVGEIVIPPATAAINGSTGAAAGLGTNDPWANISY